MFCQICGSQLPDNVAFCTHCGAPVDRPAEDPLKPDQAAETAETVSQVSEGQGEPTPIFVPTGRVEQTYPSEPAPVYEPSPAEPAPAPVYESHPVEPVQTRVQPVHVQPVAVPQPVVIQSQPAQNPTPSVDLIPENYRPISPWAYWGLKLLYSIPIVGFVFLIVFTFSRGNINRRNFTRSYWCDAIIAAVICLIVFLIVLIIALATGTDGREFGRFFEELFEDIGRALR